jgi:hypothetical protein
MDIMRSEVLAAVKVLALVFWFMIFWSYSAGAYQCFGRKLSPPFEGLSESSVT